MLILRRYGEFRASAVPPHSSCKRPRVPHAPLSRYHGIRRRAKLRRYGFLPPAPLSLRRRRLVLFRASRRRDEETPHLDVLPGNRETTWMHLRHSLPSPTSRPSASTRESSALCVSSPDRQPRRRAAVIAGRHNRGGFDFPCATGTRESVPRQCQSSIEIRIPHRVSAFESTTDGPVIITSRVISR